MLEWIILVKLCMVVVERLSINLDNEIQMCSKENIVLLLWLGFGEPFVTMFMDQRCVRV
jgi:hypothetical protein